MANTSSSPPENRPADKPVVRPRDTVGDLLRRTRQEQGVEVEQVAGTLRIRSSYITAIEQGRYDRLPGPVYALGFVRTYANALGLDGDEAVRRFKLESAGLEQRHDLAFPMPLTSRNIPGGRVVLVAFVLAVCAYAIWHYVSTSDRERPERVAAVPSDLLPPAPAPAAPSQAAPASQPAPAPSAQSSDAPGPATPPAQPQGAAPQSVTANPTAPLPPPVSASPLPPPAAPAQAATAPAPASAPGLALVAPPAPPATPPTQSTSPAPSPAAPPAPSSASETAAAPVPTPALAPGAAVVPAPATPPADQTAAAAPATAPSEPAQPHIYGAVDGPSHITLLAKQDCWIQVRNEGDPSQPLVAQRTLHKGDSYRVPDKSGLVLRTGNATGLEVMVDDRAVPALGGTVRTVALDPARLMSGSALE